MSEKLTYNQINEQKASAYMNRSKENPTVLVPRSDGRITVGQFDMDAREVHFTEDGQELVKSVLSPEAVSDQRQAQLASELAGVALRDEDFPMLDGDRELDMNAAARPEVDAEKMNRARIAADNKYQSVRNSGGTHEEAEAVADRVWRNHGF